MQKSNSAITVGQNAKTPIVNQIKPNITNNKVNEALDNLKNQLKVLKN